uniref:Uncharacterized protein n=1 Tax=uncultured marine group II/III euryarchaeote KM3_205_F07 TaxID=1456425 RepID=A0A075GZB8_9EURY|nr:hypothetical protein [uncultured marine group II/III euryarchaeote KM3_205_F07]
MLYRIENLRTIDAQEFTVSENGPLSDNPDIFNPDKEDVQETQDEQHELLVVEARKTEGRVGGRDLFDILVREGWSSQERPIITPSGVLVNGNCRVATIEEILNLNRTGEDGDTRIDGIDLANPLIEVKVTPTEPEDPLTIIRLERLLQRDDRGRLNYDWIQNTTDIRRMAAAGMSDEEVYEEYKHLTDYQTRPKLQAMRNTRDLLDSLLEELGRPGEAYSLHTNKFMMMHAEKLMRHDNFSNESDKQLLKALILQMVQCVLHEEVEGYMYGSLQEVKGPIDARRMLDQMSENTGVSIETVTEETDPITEEITRIVTINTENITSMDGDALRSQSRTISETANDISSDRRDGDVVNRPANKVSAANLEVERALEAVERASEQDVVINSEDLLEKIDVLKRSVQMLLEKVDNLQNQG